MWRRATNTRGRGRWGRPGITLVEITVVLGGAFLLATVSRRPATGGAPPGPSTERISVASNGDQANDRSLFPAPNADGSIVAFKSQASNLVPDDRNGWVDVYVRDRGQQTTQRVSVTDIPGTESNGNSFPPAVDHAGDIVAYASLASNILIGDFNMGADVFVFNRPSNTTTVVSLVSDGRGGGGAPDLAPSVTGDGGLVAFTAFADDLVLTDANEANDVFVRSPNGGPIELISVISSGPQQGHAGNGPSGGPAISADGCLVAFYSDATNLVSGDTNGFRDVFVRDRCNHTTERVSLASDGEQANRPSQAAGFSVTISADGRFVGFASDASNLDTGDDNNTTDIFVRDREAGTTTRVSKNSAGENANGPSQYASLSGDGRFIVFQSAASNLVENDTNGKTDIFVVDAANGAVGRASLTSTGEQANGDSNFPQISVDGTTVVFQSEATNLVPDDTNGTTDCFAAVNPLAGPPETPTNTPTPTATMTATVADTHTPTPLEPTLTPSLAPTATSTTTPGLTATPTPTGTRVHTPTSTATRTSTPRAPTPTSTATGTAVPAPAGGGGGGCSCRIDAGSAPASDWGLVPAIGLPLLLWVARNRRRRLH